MAIPANQLQVLVKDGDALPHVIERGLQNFAIVLDRRIGIVEQLQCRLGGDRALAQQQRKHQARGSAADRRSQNVLGVTDEAEIGVVLEFEADALRSGEGLEGRTCPLLTKVARDRRCQLLDRHGRAPEPEARRNRRQVRRNKMLACSRSIGDGSRCKEKPI